MCQCEFFIIFIYENCVGSEVKKVRNVKDVHHLFSVTICDSDSNHNAWRAIHKNDVTIIYGLANGISLIRAPCNTKFWRGTDSHNIELSKRKCSKKFLAMSAAFLDQFLKIFFQFLYLKDFPFKKKSSMSINCPSNCGITDFFTV